MPDLEIPRGLRVALGDGAVAADIDSLRRAVAQIASRNAMPFFPAFTDHGVDHIQAVLTWADRLVGKDARAKLAERDAALIVGGVLLHDIGMLLPHAGFAALVDLMNPWPAPIPEFAAERRSRYPDRPWTDEWAQFKAEARRLDRSEIVRIFGQEQDAVPAIAYRDDLPVVWGEDDELLVGEFVRRHHARLAHEIAAYGFPGVGAEWPAPDDALRRLRELMGLVARSHHMSLRDLVEHLRAEHGTSPRVGRVPFAAAVLRIADYAQLGAERAPPLLLRMTAPQSKDSLAAWRAHAPVEHVTVDDDVDPGALAFDVSPDLGLATYLQLGELFTGLQRELDECAAVLAEVYDTTSPLARLTRQRVRTNLDSPDFRERLAFVPRVSRLHSAQDMFRLVVHDLYGDHPWVGGRELVQNAVDAVRERRHLATIFPYIGPPTLDDGLDADVCVEVVVAGDRIILEVTDRGVGMTADTVVDHYLRVGSSLRASDVMLARSAIEPGRASGAAGRFGIGALAAFLLSDRVEVTTRSIDGSEGVRFAYGLDDDLVPLFRIGREVRFGTTVRLELSDAAVKSLMPYHVRVLAEEDAESRVGSVARRLAQELDGCYALAEPSLQVRVTEGDKSTIYSRAATVPAGQGGRWTAFTPDEVDLVLWSIPSDGQDEHPYPRNWDEPSEEGSVVHNGMRVVDPNSRDRKAFWWRGTDARRVLREPAVALFDSRERVALTLNRYRLRSGLPVESELLVSIAREIVARALVSGTPTTFALGLRPWLRPAVSPSGWFPLLPGLPGRLGVDGVVLVSTPARQHLGELHAAVESRLRQFTDVHLVVAGGLAGRFSPKRRRASVTTMVEVLERNQRDVYEPLGLAVRQHRFGARRIDGAPDEAGPFDVSSWPTGTPDRVAISLSTGGDGSSPVVCFDQSGSPGVAGWDPVVRAGVGAVFGRPVLLAELGPCAVDAHPGSSWVPVLADTWMGLVGEEVPHDPEARDALAERVFTANPDVAERAAACRRLKSRTS